MDRREINESLLEWGQIAATTEGDPLGVVEFPNGLEAAKAVIRRQATDLVPTTATIAAIGRGEKAPMIAAASPADRALYLLDVLPLEQPPAAARGRCYRLALDPSRCNVSMISEYRQQFGGDFRLAEWAFELGDVDLRFESHTDIDGEASNQEAFARALCEAIGWERPTDASLRAAA